MTKQEVEKRIMDITDALYRIQDRIKREGITEDQLRVAGIVEVIDDRYKLVRTRIRYDIRRIDSDLLIKSVHAYQAWTRIIGLLVERFLKIYDE